jgi:hypothetical protein
MDVETHRRHAQTGKPIAPGEAARLARLLAEDVPEAPCHELLVEIARTGVWVEQEAMVGT